MAKIKVHILNFHGPFTHIEIVLENTEANTYYGINRWATPTKDWVHNGPEQSYMDWASSVYSFDIEANPDEIVRKWREYWFSTESTASILGNNCGVAAEWFLNEIAGIPKPNLSNLSLNLLAFGLMWPSFIPCPVTLPGRVMSNAKFHVEAYRNAELNKQYSDAFLYTSMALCAVTLSASIFGLIMASTILSGSIALLTAGGCIASGALSTHGFFTSYNILSAKMLTDNLKKTDKLPAFMQGDYAPA